MHHRIKISENCITVKGNFSSNKVEDHIIENLWMPIKKRYINEHQLAIAMCTVHTEGMTTLNFYADIRNCTGDHEPHVTAAIGELATKMDEHFTDNDAVFVDEEDKPPSIHLATMATA